LIETKTQSQEITCFNCGGVIERRLYLSDISRRINLFCCKACIYEWRRKGLGKWHSEFKKKQRKELFPKFELKPLPWICSQSRNLCKNCRQIFEEGCRFNGTLSFWS